MDKNIVFFFTVVLAILGSCGGADDTPKANAGATDHRAPDETETAAMLEAIEPIIQRELARQEAVSAVRFPCTILSEDAASELLGGQVDAPGYAYEHKNYNNNLFEADACTWSALGDGPSLYVWVSLPSHFPDGSVRCVTIDETRPGEQIAGGVAQWSWQRSYNWAQLNVCREDGLFFVQIHDAIGGEADARAASAKIAEHIAVAL